jgi:hypothetical protein
LVETVKEKMERYINNKETANAKEEHITRLRKALSDLLGVTTRMLMDTDGDLDPEIEVVRKEALTAWIETGGIVKQKEVGK